MGFGGRTSIIRSLMPKHCERILDVGCGPLSSSYPFADKADQVTCIDFSIKPIDGLPPNVKFIAGDFTALNLAPNSYDCVIAADVFEHILLEQESLFVSQCVAALKPGGVFVISVPHQGRFAFLDPYQVKPAICRMLAGLGLYKKVHNGACDIRKGHKHYSIQELVDKFRPLELSKVTYFGYLFDPLVSWAIALFRGPGRLPGFSLLEEARRKELERDYGLRSFNMAASFSKP